MSIEDLASRRIMAYKGDSKLPPKANEQLTELERLAYCVGARDSEITARRAFCVAIRCSKCTFRTCSCHRLKSFVKELEIQREYLAEEENNNENLYTYR